jgi:regulation of enolase protein 1 (concanavalin A-like superfamily)
VTRRKAILVFALGTVASVTAGVGQTRLRAQSVPRPAVTVTHAPVLFLIAKPAELNDDGHLDIVGTTSSLDLQAALGRGDGTFQAPRSLGRRGRPLVVGDLNNDGLSDIVADIAATGVAILPGRGDGSFGAPRVVDSSAVPLNDVEIQQRALVVDFDGDGAMDLALIDDTMVVIYPGHGDFTFGARVELPSPNGPIALVAADFNGDGRMDIAASTPGPTVDVFLNRGAFLFAGSSLQVAISMWDIAAIDLNQDGRQDLVVTTSSGGNAGQGPGAIHVMLGNGDGTFQASVAHATGARGALAVAVGDFNHDGHPDVATGNRSTLNVDTNCTGFVFWDSVTILPGTGNGTFGEPATFRLGMRNTLDETYQNSLGGLVAADLNGDGWTDLVSSPGATLLSRAPAANRPPTVSAGPDQTIESGNDIRFDAFAIDADNDWLDFVWRDASGAVVGPNFDEIQGLPLFCMGAEAGTYTLTVTDRRGGTASDSFTVFPPSPDDVAIVVDRPAIEETLGTATPYTLVWGSRNLTGAASFRVQSSADNGKTWTTIPGCGSLPATATKCVWNTPGPPTDAARVQVEAFNGSGTRLAFDVSERFHIVAGPTTALPFGWSQHDVGTVGAAGSSTYDGTTFTVKGAGADIWGTADEFHYALTLISGDFDIVARVDSVQNVNPWTKAGLMIREQLDPGARHASIFVTPSTVKGIAFQRRPTMSGTSVSTAGPAITAPVWLRLARAGNQVLAYYRTSSSGAWTLVGAQTFPALNNGLQVGLAVSSHVHATLATATFDHVQVIPPDTHLPPGWHEEDVGSVGAAGSAEATVSTARVTGAGADIWGTADEFHWAFRTATGDFSIESLVDSVENVNRWTKAGLMIRASSAAGSQHASVWATPTTQKGVVFQGRPAANGASVQQGSSVLVAPAVWLRLTRADGDIRAYYRKTKADAWVNLGKMTLTGLPPTVKVGIAVSSHVDGALATANFSQMTIEPLLTWTTAQIGPGASDSFVDGTFFSAQNRGADIWGTSDAFTYVFTRWSGDGALTARINHLDLADAWTKGGVMFRESLDAGSRHAFVLASAEKGLALQYRASTNGISAMAGAVPGKNAPGEFDPGFWLQIIREGDVFKAYVSADATTWSLFGQAAMAMSANLFVGIAVTSHNVNQSAWGLFDDVTLRRGAFSPTPTPP